VARVKASPEADIAARLADVERRTWHADLRDIGIPVELAALLAVPDSGSRAQALAAAKAAYAASIEAARKAVPGAPPAGGLPISPASIPTPLGPTPAAKAAAAWTAIQKTVVDMGRKPR
jgi:hypothetical protein